MHVEAHEHSAAPPPTPRPKVIYILGWGHSGSTLLDMILGTAPQVASVGEVIFFDYYHKQIPHPKVYWGSKCTCGQTFQNCPFWQNTLAAVPPDLSLVYDQSGVTRLKWVWWFVRHLLSGRTWYPPNHPIGDDDELFPAVLKTAGPSVQYICDSSKDFSRFARLLMNPDLDVYPIFLVRDARAVAHSYTKKVREELALNKLGYVESLFMWIAVNLASRLLLALDGRPHLHVSYDQFCKDPLPTIRALNRWLGISIDEEHFVQNIGRQTYHNIGGNWGRIKKVEKIQYDDHWRQQAPPLGRWIGTVLCAPFNWLWVNHP